MVILQQISVKQKIIDLKKLYSKEKLIIKKNKKLIINHIKFLIDRYLINIDKIT